MGIMTRLPHRFSARLGATDIPGSASEDTSFLLA
jgi:hypothetical protein